MSRRPEAGPPAGGPGRARVWLFRLVWVLGLMFFAAAIWVLVGLEGLTLRGSSEMGRAARGVYGRSVDAADRPAVCDEALRRVCLQDELWEVDPCHGEERRVEICPHGCDEGQCRLGRSDPCHGESELGRCDGQVARGCPGGRLFAEDCEARDKVCVMTHDGPACRTPGPNDCGADFRARCVGETLERCVEGRIDKIDCGLLAGECRTRPRGARCVVESPGVAYALDECGPCGCPESGSSEEICDGADNDQDGYIDENLDCGEIDLIAFVLKDPGGEPAIDTETLESELGRVAQVFAGPENNYPLRFRWADIVEIEQPAWWSAAEEEILQMQRAAVLHPERASFYIPVVFGGEITLEDVPRAGLSTLPHNQCGGVRGGERGGTQLGITLVARRHTAMTLAHELGHFLGLCHTHAQREPVLEVDGGEAGLSCGRVCESEGDGVCDTVYDPGPALCRVEAGCSTVCEVSAQPDPANVMSYYAGCREAFSEEQALLMRRVLALRRAWHRCLSPQGCACIPGRREGEGACPAEMSCRPTQPLDESPESAPWRCHFDGPGVVGGRCRDQLDCGQGTLCVSWQGQEQGRCVRPCDAQTLRCECEPQANYAFGLCRDDFDRQTQAE